MRRAVFVVPGDINARTGGYIYDRRMVEALRGRGWCVEVRNGDLATLPAGALTIVDGLSLLTLAADIERHSPRLRIVALVHLPLALEPGLPAGDAERRDRLEQRLLCASTLIVATGRVTVEHLVRRRVDRERIALVEPGTDPAALARGSGGHVVAMVAVGALTPGKGHEMLVRALAAVPSSRWALTCAGSVERDPTTTARVRSAIVELGIADRVRLAGELDEAHLAELYDRSDLFVLATLRETYGMAVAEAIARGIPVVSSRVGAIPDIVGRGGVLVEPGDVAALTMALTRVVSDAGYRAELAEAARAARGQLHSWDEAAATLEAALSRADVNG